MLPVVLVGLAAALFAGLIYLGRERLGAAGLGFTFLRTVALVALILAFFNPGWTRREAGGPPVVLLDGSLSMGASGADWAAALDTARVLAASDDGSVRQFGSIFQVPDTTAPILGASRLTGALLGQSAGSRPVVVVTDGEIDDAGSLRPSLLNGLEVVVLPRDTVPDVALLDVVTAERVVVGDTIRMNLVLGTWGDLGDSTAQLEVFSGQRRVHVETVTLPPSPGVARRSLAIPPRAFGGGTHVLRVRVTAEGDGEPADDERWRVVTVATQPDVVVLVDPADVEGRFLVSELSAVARSGVKGYARIQSNVWIDVVTTARIPESTVRDAARGAVLLVLRGARALAGGGDAQSRWYWPAASDPTAEFFEGDWYVSTELPSSPLAGRLASVEWDSLPPLSGVVPVVAGESEWVAMTGRRGRRGADQPLLVGHDTAGVRRLTTAATGMWRWDLRGGAAREAYRAVIAAGTDWLLGTGAGRRNALLTASSSVQRGVPIAFRWNGPDVPDSLIASVTGDSTVQLTLRFDANGISLHAFEPGTYRWSVSEAGRASGVTVVETYSDEFHPRPVTLDNRSGDGGVSLIVQYARDKWWLFSIAMLAFIGEWGWRQRRGLP